MQAKALTFGLISLLFAASMSLSNSGSQQVWLVDLDGAVGPASVDLILRTLDDAQADDAQALIIRMNTPGGLDKAMRDLVQGILASEIPVITYVAPNGARAASAGTYIAYASHIAAMAPATNIGSSTPVSIAPQPSTPTNPSTSPGKDPAEKTPTPLDAMGKKVINDAVAYLQGLAELRGRNIEWAEETVRDGANLRASLALDTNVIDLIAKDLPELLEAVDGKQVTTTSGIRTLQTSQSQVKVITTDWRHELLTTITDPSIAYGLLIVGLYALMLEFYNPGLIIPALTGIICILLGAYGLQLLPVNYAGVALVGLGIALMVAEVITPTFGALGIGGLIAFVLGSMMMFDSEIPGYQLPISIVAGFAAATGLIVFLGVGLALKARQQKVVTGVEAMLGATATVSHTFAPHHDEFVGDVHVWGEEWQAQCSESLQVGEEVSVRGIDGLTLQVTKEQT